MNEQAFLHQVRYCKEQLRMQIARSEIPDGTRLDEVQIRRETGATVRAVRAALSELVREGLIVRKRHIGTFVASRLPAASAAVLPKLCSVGVLSSLQAEAFEHDAFCFNVLRGLRLTLQPPARITWLLHGSGRKMTVDDLPTVDLDAVKRSCQGIVAIEAYGEAQLNELSRGGMPLVVVDFSPPQAAFDSVEADHFQAGYLATRHLLELGHRHIAYLGEGFVTHPADPTWQARLNGYLRAMAEAGVDGCSRLILNTRRDDANVPKHVPAFDRRETPTAYMVCSGQTAEPLTKVLADAGRRVPQDVSIAAADSSAYLAAGLILSQARIDYEVLGRTAARMLAARLACKTMLPVKHVLPVFISPGQTSSACSRLA